MEIKKIINAPLWGAGVRENCIAYWRKRGFVFSETSGDHLTAQRGSYWGNLTSCNMSHLKATLTIESWGGAGIVCTMQVDVSMQVITQWNEAHWHLEMDTLESLLLTGDAREAEWAKLRSESRKADLRYFLTLGLTTRQIPPRS